MFASIIGGWIKALKLALGATLPDIIFVPLCLLLILLVNALFWYFPLTRLAVRAAWLLLAFCREVVTGVPRAIKSILRDYVRVDWPLTVLLIHLLLFLPLISRGTDNAPMLASFINDEPPLTMALEAMTVPPYGNPANFYTDGGAKPLPPHWYNLRYTFFYYGGFYLDVALLLFAPLKLLGAATFPWAPLCLRTVSVLSSLLSLVLLYNFGKRHSGVLAGLLAVGLLLTDTYFAYYTMIIHPDTLQLCLSLGALMLAVRHAADGDVGSLAALGTVAGLVQGTKCGGPWLVPMAFLATWMGWRQTTAAWRWPRLAGRVSLLGAAALLFFALSTPYAFLDPFYKAKVTYWWSAITAGTFDPVDFSTWIVAVREHLGWLLSVGILVGLAGAAWRLGRRRLETPLLLACVLAVSNVLWYCCLGKLWVQVSYLLPAFGLLFMLMGDVLGACCYQAGALGVGGRWTARLALAGLLLCLLLQRWFPVTDMGLAWQNHRQFTNIQINDWAAAHLPHDSKIVCDDIAYLSPEIFPNQKMHGGIMRHLDLRAYRPDYLILCSTIFDAPYYQKLRKKQNLPALDSNPFCMRLYQDLLDGDLPLDRPGPTAVPGLELVAVLSPPLPPRTGAASGEELAYSGIDLLLKGLPPPEGNALEKLRGELYQAARLVCGRFRGKGLVLGPRLLVFRVNQDLVDCDDDAAEAQEFEPPDAGRPRFWRFLADDPQARGVALEGLTPID